MDFVQSQKSPQTETNYELLYVPEINTTGTPDHTQHRTQPRGTHKTREGPRTGQLDLNRGPRGNKTKK